MSSFATLQRLARQAKVIERCDLCGVGVAENHQHLLNPAARKLVCACDACAVLFFQTGETKLKRVPRRISALKNFNLTDAQWDALLIPIGLAFFVDSTAEQRVVVQYPSPAGPTESLLSLDVWAEIVLENPVLERLLPDVEALLINRLGVDPEYYIVPIDKAYELVGLIRANWRGFSGCDEVWQKIREFFNRIQKVAHA